MRSFVPIFLFLVFSLLMGCSYSGRAARTPIPTPALSPTSSPSVTPSPTSMETPSPSASPTPTDTPTIDPSLPTSTITRTSTSTRTPTHTRTSTPTRTLTRTPVPTRTRTPTLTRRPRTPTPTFTPSQTPTLDRSNVILRIAVPGPMSKLVSPINFVVYISPEYTGLTRIELLGEDGRELYRKVFRTFSNIGSTSRVDEKINFEIHGTAEVGRLQISTLDEYNRLQAFNSVRVLLLSVGENEFSPSYPPMERMALRQPQKGDELGGGELSVSGEIQPWNDTPVVMELLDIDGKVVGSRILSFAPADGAYQTFSASLPYTLKKKMPARLIFRQSDDRFSGMVYLYSIRLWVNP